MRNRESSNPSTQDFQLIGCSSCGFTFVIERKDHYDRIECRRCHTSRPSSSYRRLRQGESKSEIREKRSRYLASKWDLADIYRDEPSYSEAEDSIDTVPGFRQQRVPKDLIDCQAISDTSESNEASEPIEQSKLKPAQAPQLVKETSKIDEPGISELPMGASPSGDIPSFEIGAASSVWGQDILKECLPETIRLYQDVLKEYGDAHRLEIAQDALGALDNPSGDTIEEINSYLVALWDLERTSRTDDDGYAFLELNDSQRQNIFTTLTRLGTGKGAHNASVDALAVFEELHSYGITHTISISLDSQDWDKKIASQPDTVERSLDMLTTLGRVFNIQIRFVAPRLKKKLRRKYPNWVAQNLSESRISSRASKEDQESKWTSDEIDAAYLGLQKFDGKSGHLKLLQELASGEKWTYESLSQHPEIELSRNSVSQYSRDLANEGFVRIDESFREHQLTISKKGKIAAYFVPEGERILDRRQLTLTESANRPTSTVCQADETWDGFEESISSFQDGSSSSRSDGNSSEFVRWMTAGDWDKVTVHRRYSLISEVFDTSGITLVSQPDLPNFSDPRKTRISHLDDHVVVVAQWGRSLPTLARICNSLLDPRLLSNALSLSEVGDGFEELFEDDLSEAEILDLLTRASQCGYLTEDEIDCYLDWRNRWASIPPRLLKRLGDLEDLSDSALVEERKELYRRFHGAIASASALYSLAGKDITIQIRFPSVDGILEDEYLVNDFKQFVRHTIPKNTLIDGIFNWNREAIEDRVEKLKYRLSPDARQLREDGVSTATSSVDWQIVGDSAHKLRPIVRDGIEQIKDDLRESIADGNETTLPLDVPIRRGNHHTTTRRLIRRIASDKGMHIGTENSVSTLVERFTTIFEATLGTDSHGPSPIDVATALLTLGTGSDERLSVSDIARGLGVLKPSHLLPCGQGKPTEQRMLSTLLRAEKPLNRDEIVSRAEVSERSLQNLETLAAFDLIERTNDSWRATIEPWWVENNSRERPYERNKTPNGGLNSWQGVVDYAIYRSEKIEHLSVSEYSDLYYNKSIETVLRTLGWFRFYPVLLHYTCNRFESSESAHIDTISVGPSQKGGGEQSRFECGSKLVV